jgi:hypothetical protein
MHHAGVPQEVECFAALDRKMRQRASFGSHSEKLSIAEDSFRESAKLKPRQQPHDPERRTSGALIGSSARTFAI